MTSGPPAPPAYASTSLANVLPAVARSIGSGRYAGVPDLGLAPARRAVVVLVDGLGDVLLRRRSGHAPFLRSHLGSALRLDCGFPSTTATSMGSFGTGLPPGQHGLVGYEVLDPDQDRVFNELSWENGPNPTAWQPLPTVFEQVATEGVGVTRIGPGFFDGSGLTTAALRGGRFQAARELDDRVVTAVTAVRSDPRALVYLYWGDLDKVGHVNGCGSWEWGDELESVDRALARLAASVPGDTAVHVTADHGMVDVPHLRRTDLAHEPVLLTGVRHVGGEPRSVQLYCEPGAAEDVLATWRTAMGRGAWVLGRDEAVRAGWFGEVADRVRPRIGDVVAMMRGEHAVVHTGRTRPELLRLIGLHGSVSVDERAVPLVSIGARDG
ncbi:nucleotide pyrophosphatase/phosphodiesterase family protein [Lapillicoccus sp.]|uniref:alkaline phosphatase family protein n=1 Tax=Lapillicoccus sp. TaxID=1909287 RepID=UPI0027CD9B6B|nr:alkaline phosphatase family protein [Actinomycetota bacterium]